MSTNRSCATSTAALLAEDVLEEVGHAQWVFVIPKMLRPYFLHHRELLGGLVLAAWETVLELLFRHKVIRMLQGEGLLSEERTELLLSWRHTGFSVHNRVRVEPEDQAAVERLARYIMRPPISLERMQWDGAGEVRYRRKAGQAAAEGRGSRGSACRCQGRRPVSGRSRPNARRAGAAPERSGLRERCARTTIWNGSGSTFQDERGRRGRRWCDERP